MGGMQMGGAQRFNERLEDGQKDGAGSRLREGGQSGQKQPMQNQQGGPVGPNSGPNNAPKLDSQNKPPLQ